MDEDVAAAGLDRTTGFGPLIAMITTVGRADCPRRRRRGSPRGSNGKPGPPASRKVGVARMSPPPASIARINSPTTARFATP